jgi:hypothetical protein
MNTIKFADAFELRTETHNVEIYDKNTLTIKIKSI